MVRAATAAEGVAPVVHRVLRGEVIMEALRNAHTQLLSAVEETLRISQEGKTKRMQAEKELSGHGAKFTDAIVLPCYGQSGANAGAGGK
jgi:uncharacterized protein YaaN involved in tellurite resistance